MASIESILKQIPQYTRSRRHLDAVMRHGTFRKLWNLGVVESERKLRRITVKGCPYLLIIDPCNYCNLKCPLCPTGMGELGRRQSMLSFERFRSYFDPFAPYLFEAYLHNWGESLLNPEIFRMAQHAQRLNVGTNLSSNFLQVSTDEIDKILDCGLEYLVISLDGTTQETYSRYRVQGDFERVVHNMESLIRRRNQRRNRTPIVEWQYIVMKHNQREVATAGKMAKAIGVDLLRFIPAGMPFEIKNRAEAAEQWFPAAFQKKTGSAERLVSGQSARPGPCFYLYRSVIINPDGGVSPCCNVYRQIRDFASLNGSAIDPPAVWNNSNYVSARSLYSRKEVRNKIDTICDSCDLFKIHPSKQKRRAP
jgi:MoaA/NifB/PqqE/SkfB family radical SAM enzyme